MEGIHPIRLDLDDPYYEELFCGATYMENYRILIQQIRKFNENIPPLINAYMNLSPTMRVFDTVSNPDFGGVEETGILVTIRDIYPEKRLRYTRWLGWRANLKHRREEFSERLREHFERIKKKAERLKTPCFPTAVRPIGRPEFCMPCSKPHISAFNDTNDSTKKHLA